MLAAACDVAILDEGVEEAARRPDAAEPKELTAWSRERLNKLKRHRAERWSSCGASSLRFAREARGSRRSRTRSATRTPSRLGGARWPWTALS